jgi:peptidoglycan-associated lipoprotein
MKNVSKLLGLFLALSALLFTACTKKPVRPDPTTTAMGKDLNNGVDPTQVALPPDSSLTSRDPNAGTVDDTNHSVVDPIYFALDRYAVAQAERSKLQAAVKWLQDNPGKNLVLVGHCDWRGTAEYNLGLGDRRANAVKRFLESMGADSKRFETLSKGSTDAKQAGGDAEWQKDRRVDFVELKK